MKYTLSLLLAALVAVGSYFWGTVNGSTTIEAPPAQWTEDNVAAAAWQKWLVSLEAAGARIFETTADPRERLDGLNYIAQLASASLEMKLAKGNPSEPQFTDWMTDHRKFLGDSPDAVYHTADISDNYDYVIEGNIHDAEYLGFMLYGESINGWNRAADNRSANSMHFDDAGEFNLLLSRERPDDYTGDWLKLEDDIHMVMVRQYFHDRTNSQEAEFSIRALAPTHHTLHTETHIAQRIEAAIRFFNETLNGNIALITMLEKNPNTFEVPKEYSQEFGGIFYPTSDNVYLGTWYSLADDEAMVIEGKAPDVDYWSISLQNRWMQSFDYRHYNTSLNNHDITIDKNGHYRVVIATREVPGVDWLSTAGFNQGLLSIRYQLANETETPTLKVVQRKMLLP